MCIYSLSTHPGQVCCESDMFEIDCYILFHTRQAFALVCRSPPPPQSRLALGRGAAVSRGKGVPELCPNLAPQNHGVGLNMEVSQVQAQLITSPRPSASRDKGGGEDLHTSANACRVCNKI